jgi:hypothetical protein
LRGRLREMWLCLSRSIYSTRMTSPPNKSLEVTPIPAASTAGSALLDRNSRTLGGAAQLYVMSLQVEARAQVLCSGCRKTSYSASTFPADRFTAKPNRECVRMLMESHEGLLDPIEVLRICPA